MWLKWPLLAVLFSCFTSVMAAPPLPAPPKVNAKAHLLMDYHSGQMLAENNIDTSLEPASLTKIMTVYVLANELKEGNISLEDEVMVSEKAWRMSGSRTFIEINKKIQLKTLLMGVIIQSGNDASVALAEHASGNEEVFVELMNQHAQRLGLKGTHFVNSTGLPDPNHYTTARDLATLATALIRDFPETYAYSKMREFTFNKIVQHNRNRLLWQDESVDGLKTGHTETAGFCLVASAERQGMRLISVVLGSASEAERATATQALLNYGFRFYETHRLYGANQPLTQVRVWKGQADQADLGLGEELFVTIPRRQYKELNAAMDLETSVIAPVEKGQAKGTLKISLKGREVAKRPLIALQSVGEGGFVHRVVDDLRMLWQ
jgi:D-alanyl-D-alanine carboxypeptidase (penicillin-binding protein 5/6)